MKGKTTIELTNVKTGKKEIYEDENMFTNALNKIYKNNFLSFGIVSNPAFFSTLIRDLTSNESLIGGVYCLDTQLDEDESIVEVPDGVGITAHAGAEYNGLSTTRGSFNSSESAYLSNGFKFVWDFATNQGNGTISSVGLTTSYGGNCGEDYGYSDSSIIAPYVSNTTQSLHVRTSDGSNKGFTYTTAGIDDDMYFYLAVANSTTSITIYKSSKPYPLNAPILISNYDTSNDAYSYFYLDEEVTITLPVAMNNTTADIGWRFILDGSNLYLIAKANSSATSLYVYELDFENGTVTTYYTVSITQAFNSYVTSTFIANGYLYVLTTDLVVNKINFTTGDVIKTSPTFTDGTTEYLHCVDYHGRLVMHGNATVSSSRYDYYYYWDEDSNKWHRMGSLQCSGSDAVVKWISPYYIIRKYNNSSSSSYTYHWMDTLLECDKPLITINNLSSTVTKTSAQTMKITYTVTEGEEE